jgi:hypothetical protein
VKLIRNLALVLLPAVLTWLMLATAYQVGRTSVHLEQIREGLKACKAMTDECKTIIDRNDASLDSIDKSLKGIHREPR